MSSQSFDAVLLRDRGNPHTITDDGRVRNLLKLKLTNRSEEGMSFEVTAIKPEGAQLNFREEELALAVGETKTFHLGIIAPRDQFVAGRSALQLKLENDNGEERVMYFQMIGPYD